VRVLRPLLVERADSPVFGQTQTPAALTSSAVLGAAGSAHSLRPSATDPNLSQRALDQRAAAAPAAAAAAAARFDDDSDASDSEEVRANCVRAAGVSG
jgi:hypothetical protein